MIQIRIEDKPSFRVVGRKVWITGQDNAQFDRFWSQSHKDGLIDALRALSGGAGKATGATTFGVSRVEKDPADRAFYFYIATECGAAPDFPPDLECFEIPACKWAIFQNRGKLPMSLIEAEMHAFMKWLPESGFRHAYAPELEVYPAHDSEMVEFWLPVVQ